MIVGLIGAGRIGKTLAHHLVQAGYSVNVSNSRLPRTLAPLIQELGAKAKAMSAGENALESDLLIEAIPFGSYESLPAVSLRGKIVISASNFFPDRDGDIPLKGGTHTELVQQHLSEAMVVKAFNTIHWENLRDQAAPNRPLEERKCIPLAGDHEDAKTTAASLIQEIGFAPLDLGPLKEGGQLMQPQQRFYNKDLTLTEAKRLLHSHS